MKTVLMIFLSYAAPWVAAQAQSCSRQSPAHTVALLELYTSEGCSSCPPADRALSQLRAQTNSATGLDQVVPLALHVDYWDHIGWKDLFSNKTFTERQRWLSNLANSRTVYTPEMFIAGQELRNLSGGIAAAVQQINRQPARADIGISLGRLSAGTLPVEVSTRTAQAGNLFVALYENELVSKVRSGENGGATLRHDYVVRQWVGPIALEAKADARKVSLNRALAVPGSAVAHNLGVAAFVQSERGEVLQALALPLCSAS